MPMTLPTDVPSPSADCQEAGTWVIPSSGKYSP